MMKKKILSILLCVVMLLGLVPAAVYSAEEYSCTAGAFTIKSSQELTEEDYTYENNVLTIKSSAEITLSTNGQTTVDRIFVADGVSANITLAGVDIDLSATKNACAFQIAVDSMGNVTLTLAAGTENVLKSGENCAGLMKGSSNIDKDAGALVIQGEGSLTVEGGMYGAGIGGGTFSAQGTHLKNLIITGGTINATSGDAGAGIGGGWVGHASGITIKGGTVTAKSKTNGAGIGGSRGGDGCNITISGGTVNAIGGDMIDSGSFKVGGGAGIGGGSTGDGHDITITGGNVYAKGGDYAAGIGGGHTSAQFSASKADYGHGYNIKITGGYVEATGGYHGAGIGSGGNSFKYNPEYYTISIWMPGAEGRNIQIFGGTVIAKGGHCGAGIGGGEGGPGHDIEIGGFVTKVTAIGGSYAAGIGGGGGYLGRSSGGDGYNITISDAEVYAEGGAAGIGAGGNNIDGVSTDPYKSGNAHDIRITDAIVTAKGDYYCGGIGSMWSYTTTKNIYITGGSVLATGLLSKNIGNEKTYVTPKNGSNQNVYLLTIPNPMDDWIEIDGRQWSARHHIDGDTNVYAYVTGTSHTVEASLRKMTYTYSNGTFTQTSLEPASNARMITYNANGGSGTMEPGFVEYAGKYLVPECGFTPPSGKYFLGWGDSTTAKVTDMPGDSVTVTNNFTFYPIWDDLVNISFDANGGSGTMDTVALKPYENYTLPSCSFTPPKGYKFKGWARSETGTPLPVNTISTGADLTFYAIWEEILPDGLKTVLDVSKGHATIGDGTLDGYTPDETHITVPDPDGYILTGYSNSDSRKVTITGGTHDIILRDLTIDVSSVAWAHAFFINGDAKLNITLEGTNTVRGGTGRNGFNMEGNASVTITSDSTGTLVASGKSNGISISENNTLTIAGGNYNLSSINGKVKIIGGNFASGNIEENKVYGVAVGGGSAVKYEEGSDFPYVIAKSGEDDGIQITLDVSQGYITLKEDFVDGYAPDGTHITTYDPDGFILTGTSTWDNKKVNILEGTHKITLRDLTIDVSKVDWAAAFTIGCTVEITLEGNNFLRGGIERAGLNIYENGHVTITAESTGSLTASSEYSSRYAAAAIGANYNGTNGTIIINGGKISASAGSSDAEPIGKGKNGDSGTIIINGGFFATGSVDANTVYSKTVSEGCSVVNIGGAYPYWVAGENDIAVTGASGSDVTLLINVSEDAKLIIARYDGDEMTEAYIEALTPGTLTKTITVDGTGTKIKSFLINDKLQPLCEAAEY